MSLFILLRVWRHRVWRPCQNRQKLHELINLFKLSLRRPCPFLFVKNQTSKSEHQDPLVQQIGICFQKFADDLGGHITTLGNSSTKNINDLNNLDNLRLTKRVGKAKNAYISLCLRLMKRMIYQRTAISVKSYSRDKSQKQELQR